MYKKYQQYVTFVIQFGLVLKKTEKVNIYKKVKKKKKLLLSKQEQLKFISLMSICIFAFIIAITCSIPPPPTLQDSELLPY